MSDLCEADSGRIFRAPPGEMESLHFSEKAGHIAATKLTHGTLCIGHAKGSPCFVPSHSRPPVKVSAELCEYSTVPTPTETGSQGMRQYNNLIYARVKKKNMR